MTEPILFVGHAADRTGPPIYLRHFLRWLRANRPEVDFEVVLLGGGPLESDFESLAPTTVLDGWFDRSAPKPLEWTLRNLGVDEPGVRSWKLWRDRQVTRQLRRLGHHRFRLVYANTAVSVQVARLLPRGQWKLLSHVHELDVGMRYHLPPEDRRVLIGRSTHIFAASEAVRRNLIDGHGVEPQRVTRHYEMVSVAEAPPPPNAAERRHRRVRKGVDPDSLVVGSGGTTDWRKATDLFLRTAWYLHKAHPHLPVTFLWIGGDEAGIARARAEVTDAGLDDTIRFVGQQTDPLSWFELFDVFLLPAREDAFPLVCLEAASVRRPIVCFDTGGMSELVEQGCGRVARYPDVAELAGHVADLLLDEELRRKLGERGAELVRERHDVSVLAPALWQDLRRWLPG